MNPFQTVVMVGDGITDLEAVQQTGGADLFVGYGGVIERSVIKEQADWFITHHDELTSALPRFKIAMIGSGAWACSAMQMVAFNARTKALFRDQVDMWVYEEDYEGGKLSVKMNELKENPKYLPGVKYGDNVVANPDLEDTVRTADLIIFCTPHQFAHRLCKQIQFCVKPAASAISLIKGIHISLDGPQLISTMVRKMLNIECSVLMGANIAKEITPDGMCETTIGAHFAEQGEIFRQLFETPYFAVKVINDTEGAELAGALKNVVAVAAGFADGCNLGQNAKAAILREGLAEMRSFARAMFPSVRDDTFFESCGVADLVATCYGGRNHKVAKAFAEAGGEKSFDELEREMLKGQKLQGILTSEEVHAVLKLKGWEDQYPLFTAVHAIANGIFEAKDIARYRDIANSPKLSETSRHEQMSLLEKKGDI
jgi:glycerol-3-phosphate dehydrogenase (NAD+)